MNDLLAELQTIFRDVFDDDGLVLDPATAAKDVDGWDSLLHVDLIIAVEAHFKIKFATAEIGRLADDDQNVGTFLEMIARKLS